MIPIEGELLGIVKMIRDLIAQGMKAEEIQERLASPSGVAKDLLDRAVARKSAGATYMGIDPDAVMVEAEDEFALPLRRDTLG